MPGGTADLAFAYNARFAFVTDAQHNHVLPRDIRRVVSLVPQSFCRSWRLSIGWFEEAAMLTRWAPSPTERTPMTGGTALPPSMRMAVSAEILASASFIGRQ